MSALNTPILFLVFNRPGSTKQAFETIRQAAPKQLFVAADGPRAGKEGEKERTDAVRAIATAVDWDCEVKTLFRDENLGCGNAVSSAISWFFGHVEKGIILEDDCLPNSSFFTFCDVMLDRFEKNEEIMHISGNNFQFSNIGNECYYLSKVPHIWGWASWRRAWQHYDFRLSAFNEQNETAYFEHGDIDRFWHFQFGDTKKRLHTWDYQWVYAIFNRKGFCIAPQNNLVSNIGFNEEGTHVTNEADYLSSLKSYELHVPSVIPMVPYSKVADINEQLFFDWIVPEKKDPNVSMKQIRRIIKNKIINKFRKY